MRHKVAFRVLDARLGTEYPLPSPATSGSAGVDLRAMLAGPAKLEPGDQELISSGLAIHLADPAFAAMVLPRSGLGHKKGLVLGNLVGLIDSDYQGEIMMSAWNRSRNPIIIEPGDRIAQLVVVPVVSVQWERVDEFAASVRGSGGFGHTGAS